jgi:hypothetical protein
MLLNCCGQNSQFQHAWKCLGQNRQSQHVWNVFWWKIFGFVHDWNVTVHKNSNCLRKIKRNHIFLFFNACILRFYLSKPLTSLRCSLNAVFPCLKMREHLCFCNFFNSACECWCRVTEKSHLFHPKPKSVRHRESNPGHPHGKQRPQPLSHPLRLPKSHSFWRRLYFCAEKKKKKKAFTTL